METTQSWKWKMSIQNICRRNVLKWNIRGHLIQVFLKPNPLSHGYNRYQGRSHLRTYIAKEHSEQNFKNLTRYQDFLRHWNLSFNIDEQILPLLSSFWDHRNHLLHANLILLVEKIYILRAWSQDHFLNSLLFRGPRRKEIFRKSIIYKVPKNTSKIDLL